MKETPFLDTGIFVAFLDRSDKWHGQAKALFSAPPRRLVTSVLVVSEAYSYFLHRHGEEPARGFRALLADLPGLTIEEGTLALQARTFAVLDQFRGAKLTMVDASSLAILRARKLGVAWSTDHHLGLSGAQVKPLHG